MGASIDSLSRLENGDDYPLMPATMQQLFVTEDADCCFIAHNLAILLYKRHKRLKKTDFKPLLPALPAETLPTGLRPE